MLTRVSNELTSYGNPVIDVALVDAKGKSSLAPIRSMKNLCNPPIRNGMKTTVVWER